jgi:hypothetical protein
MNYVILYYIILYLLLYVISIMLYYITLHYIISYYIILYYVLLHFHIQFDLSVVDDSISFQEGMLIYQHSLTYQLQKIKFHLREEC